MKTLFLLLATVFLISGCDKEIPVWNGKIYVMWPAKDGIVRMQDPVEPFISAQNPKVHGYVVFTQDGFKSFVQTYVAGCESWNKNLTMRSVGDREVQWLYSK